MELTMKRTLALTTLLLSAGLVSTTAQPHNQLNSPVLIA